MAAGAPSVAIAILLMPRILEQLSPRRRTTYAPEEKNGGRIRRDTLPPCLASCRPFRCRNQKNYFVITASTPPQTDIATIQ
jgi:hypothetical protein